MKKWYKCKCGLEYAQFRYKCPACGTSCDNAKPCLGWDFYVAAYIPDEELEDTLCDADGHGWKIYRWDRNKENRAGVENSTITFRKRRYEQGAQE